MKLEGLFLTLLMYAAKVGVIAVVVMLLTAIINWQLHRPGIGAFADTLLYTGIGAICIGSLGYFVAAYGSAGRDYREVLTFMAGSPVATAQKDWEDRVARIPSFSVTMLAGIVCIVVSVMIKRPW
jgi:hypothetical protein